METKTYTPAIIAKKNKIIMGLEKACLHDEHRIRKATASCLNEYLLVDHLEKEIVEMSKSNKGGHK